MFLFCFFLQEAVTKTGRLHVSLYKHNKPPCVYRWARQFPVFSPSVLNPQTFQKLRFKKTNKKNTVQKFLQSKHRCPQWLIRSSPDPYPHGIAVITHYQWRQNIRCCMIVEYKVFSFWLYFSQRVQMKTCQSYAVLSKSIAIHHSGSKKKKICKKKINK